MSRRNCYDGRCDDRRIYDTGGYDSWDSFDDCFENDFESPQRRPPSNIGRRSSNSSAPIKSRNPSSSGRKSSSSDGRKLSSSGGRKSSSSGGQKSSSSKQGSCRCNSGCGGGCGCGCGR